MLKQCFIPTKSNFYHPYILRPLGIFIVIVLVLVQPTIYNLTTHKHLQLIDYATDITAGELLSLTNQQRVSAGIASLQDNSRLDEAAQAKATDMFAKDYWAHNSPTGETPWDFILQSGYHYYSAGENLAKDFSTSSGVVDAWMASSEHRANILNTTYVDIGFAVMNGTLLGSQTTLVVAMFGSPQKTATPSTVSSIAPKTTSSPKQATSVSPTVAAPQTVTSSPVQTPPPWSASSPDTSIGPSPAPPPLPTATPSTKTVNLSLVAKVEHLNDLNWGQRASVFLLSTLLFFEVLKHTVVWRKQKRGWRHVWMRSHPAFQTSLILIMLLVVIANSYGTIK